MTTSSAPSPLKSPTTIWSFGLNCHEPEDRKSTRLNSSHLGISYAVFCLKKKKESHSAREPAVIRDDRPRHVSLGLAPGPSYWLIEIRTAEHQIRTRDPRQQTAANPVNMS